MRRLSLALIVTFLIVSAPSADAQLRGLINRARAAVSGGAEQAQEAASRAVDRPPARADGAPATAIDYASLLDMRFYPQRGTFGLGDAFLLFPAPGLLERDEIQSRYYIREASGREVVRHTVRTVEPTGSAAIARLSPRSGAVDDFSNALEDGKSYTMDIEVYGDLVGSMPFSVTQTSNGDPYDPVTTMVLEGPWRTHAYFSHETDHPDRMMHLHAWVGVGEMESNKQTEVSIRRDGQEVAFGTGFSNMTYGWGHVEYDLYTADSRDRRGRYARYQAGDSRLWTIGDVTPGTYEIVFSSEEGGPFRTMTIEGGDGAFVPHPRSALDYEPRARFLTSRRMSGQNLDRNNALYWIAP